MGQQPADKPRICHRCSRPYWSIRCCAVSARDIAWLAGLLEGEGNFRLTKAWNERFYPWIALKMTDADVVSKAQRLLGVGSFAISMPHLPHHKVQYRTVATGASAVGWMMTIYGLLGERRRGQIRKVLSHWRVSDYGTHSGEFVRGRFRRFRDHKGRWAATLRASA